MVAPTFCRPAFSSGLGGCTFLPPLTRAALASSVSTFEASQPRFSAAEAASVSAFWVAASGLLKASVLSRKLFFASQPLGSWTFFMLSQILLARPADPVVLTVVDTERTVGEKGRRV